MKKDLHPPYYYVEVSCACGASWMTRSTQKGGIKAVSYTHLTLPTIYSV